MLALHKLTSMADVTVGHNIKKFDDRRANTDFIKHGLIPPPKHKMIDTLEFARHKFDFESNKLDDLAQFLKIGKKVKHWGFELWERCMNGDPVAWALMKKYNKADVDPLLEGVYLKMRPWMTNHPNVCALDARPGCPVCRSRRVRRNGYNINQWGRSLRFRCQDCGKSMVGTYTKGGWRFK